MEINLWIKSRESKGALAEVARRILESDRKYKDVEKTLQGMYVLEALIKHDGNQQRAAAAIGVSRETVKRAIRSMNLKAADIRAIVEHTRSANAGA